MCNQYEPESPKAKLHQGKYVEQLLVFISKVDAIILMDHFLSSGPNISKWAAEKSHSEAK